MINNQIGNTIVTPTTTKTPGQLPTTYYDPHKQIGEISGVPLWIKHTPARLATNILTHNRLTKYSQVAVIGLAGSGKSTATRCLIHALHVKEPGYRVHFYYKDDILRLDKILKSLPKRQDVILFFDDISFLLDSLPEKRLFEILHTLTIIREILDPKYKQTKAIVFMDFHYSYALLKAFRQTNFRIITSITDEERENYNKVFGYNNRDNIKQYVRKYLTMMRYNYFKIPSPTKDDFVYKTDAPFRLALCSNLGELHYMLYHTVKCNVCNPIALDEKIGIESWDKLLKVHSANLVYQVLRQYVYLRSGKAVIPINQRRIYNFLELHSRSYRLDFDAILEIFKKSKDFDIPDRRDIVIKSLQELEKRQLEQVEKTTSDINAPNVDNIDKSEENLDVGKETEEDKQKYAKYDDELGVDDKSDEGSDIEPEEDDNINFKTSIFARFGKFSANSK